MTHISANELKIKGVAAIEAVLADHAEAIVSVRGKDRFVVMDMWRNTIICVNASSTPRWRRRAPIWLRGALCRSPRKRMWRGLTSWHELDAGLYRCL
jgi:hypothetical protein